MTTVEKQKRHRSPNYPMFDLGTAVAKAKSLFATMKRHSVGADVVIAKLGYTPKSSSGVKALAALRSFDLLEDDKGDGDSTVRFSETGLDIVADCVDGSGAWQAAVRKAALAPAIHKELWDKYGGAIPPDEELRRYLVRVREQTFNDNSVDEFIDEFKKTVAYAKLIKGDIILGGNEQIDGGSDENPKVGDLVQWTSSGVDQFTEPRRLMGLSDDGLWAFVDGSTTGIPVEELMITESAKSVDSVKAEEKSPRGTPPPNPYASKTPSGSAQEILMLDEGQVVLQWPTSLSQESAKDLEYWITGVLNRARRRAGISSGK